MFNNNYDFYAKHYDQKKIVDKLAKSALKGGKKIIYVVLLLYYTLQKDQVPLKAKSVIIGALGYFIAPLDLIPDFIPIIGYTDDFGALMVALATVSMYIDDGIKEKARTKLTDWFGVVSEQELRGVNKRL